MSISSISSRRDPVTKQEALAERKEAGEPFASRYRASVEDTEAEAQRLTFLLQNGEYLRPVKVRLQALGPELWPEALLEVYGQARHADYRRQLVIQAIFVARESETARRLGVAALKDRSYGVRVRAAQVLAYSLDRSVLPALREALRFESRDEVRESFQAAISAIDGQNHNVYIDRQERGNCRWGVNPWDPGDPAVQRGVLCYEVEKIREAWETEI